jgi:hypothetical protein
MATQILLRYLAATGISHFFDRSPHDGACDFLRLSRNGAVVVAKASEAAP